MPLWLHDQSEVSRRCTGTIASDAVHVWSESVPWWTSDIRLRRVRYARSTAAAAA